MLDLVHERLRGACVVCWRDMESDVVRTAQDVRAEKRRGATCHRCQLSQHQHEEEVMRYYLDAEYTRFGGELMSLALVPADPALESFYVAVEWGGTTDPWVEAHVVPHLGSEVVSRALASRQLATFMRDRAVGHMVIVADWPTDFEHLLALLIIGPGRMQPVPNFDMKFQRLPGFNTASTSRVPHNALADAEALRDYCEANPG